MGKVGGDFMEEVDSEELGFCQLKKSTTSTAHPEASGVASWESCAVGLWAPVLLWSLALCSHLGTREQTGCGLGLVPRPLV